MEWKFDGVDEGARRSEKSLTNGKIFSLFQIVERGRKIHEEKKMRAPPLFSPPLPVFPVYNLTRSPLTAALYYPMNPWNMLQDFRNGAWR